jgi:hypothetical protein
MCITVWWNEHAVHDYVIQSLALSRALGTLEPLCTLLFAVVLLPPIGRLMHYYIDHKHPPRCKLSSSVLLNTGYSPRLFLDLCSKLMQSAINCTLGAFCQARHTERVVRFAEIATVTILLCR